MASLSNAQNLVGAWEGVSTNDEGIELKSIVIFSEGYQVIAVYESKTGKFISTNGGSWKLDGQTMTEVIEFDTENPDRVGSEISFEVDITPSTIQIVGSPLKLNRVDDGLPGTLQGAWLMSGRIRDGETQLRDTTRPRKTMKILSGTRFQWIAYNTETKEFKGTGGGTYTTQDGVYKENIEFFSKDNAKAGISLAYDYEQLHGDWHHKGFSSKGDPIHEIWRLRH